MPNPYSPTSSLSELSSEELDGIDADVKLHERSASPYHDPDHDPDPRPSKRRRTGGHVSWDPRDAGGVSSHFAPAEEDAFVSEDTDGSVPGSPTHVSGMMGAGQDEDAFAGEQITACKWDGCPAGNLGNMDRLVEHLNNDHIQAKQKKYSCEWMDCSRKGTPHASGYALRAHMRSHTREKPFYCSLPECDRSFTRSDALAKHMRTVHETEALRPSDPVPKHHSSNPSNKFQRLRLTLKPANGGVASDKSAPASPSLSMHGGHNPTQYVEYDHVNVVYIPDEAGGLRPQFPPDISWTEDEMRMHPKDLLMLLQRQLEWAGEDADDLKREVSALEAARREEWMQKELVLENIMEAELAVSEERFGTKRPVFEESTLAKMEQDALLTKELQLHGGTEATPWWRVRGKLKDKMGGGGGCRDD